MKVLYRRALPAFAVAIALSGINPAEAQTKRRATGFVPEPKSVMRSFPSVPRMRGFLPEQVDLSGKFPVPGDQGQQSSCVAWAVGYAVRSYYEGRAGNWQFASADQLISPAYIYNSLQGYSGRCDEGTAISDALRLLEKSGAPTLSLYPYIENDCARQPDASLGSIASQYRIRSWRTIEAGKLDDVKGQLRAGNPVVFGMEISDSFEELPAGRIYDDTSSPRTGNHAMVIVGYDERQQAFKLINSWGTDWADKGFGWVSYRALKQLSEHYFVMDVEDTPRPVAVAPAPVAIAPPVAPAPAVVPPKPEPVVVTTVEVAPPKPVPAPAPVVAPKPTPVAVTPVEVTPPKPAPAPVAVVPPVQPVVTPKPAPVVAVTPPVAPAPEPVVKPKPETVAIAPVEIAPPKPAPVTPKVEPAPVAVIAPPAPKPVVAPAPQPVAVVAPPPPKPVAKPVLPLAIPELQKVVSSKAREVECARLDASVGNDRNVRLRGFVGSADDLARLRSDFAALPGVRSVDAQVDVYTWPQCEVYLNFDTALAEKRGLQGRLAGGAGIEFKESDSLSIEVQTPSYPSYLYVSYLQASGEVVNLSWPQGRFPKAVPPNTKVTFGGGQRGEPTYRIGAPFGDEIIVVVASASPLFQDELPETATDREYLTSFRRAFLVQPKGGGQRVVSAIALPLRTKPQGQ